ncbi:MAG: hypothetical protein Q9160_002573 [Pyrenula sp. 1 TL-2023]
MAEPLPSASEGGVTTAESPEDARLPTNAEDRKAAAALSSLNANEISADSSHEAAAPKTMSAADQEALGKAMSRLEIASGASATAKKEDAAAGEILAGKKKERGDARKKAEEEKEKRRKVKVKAEDVAVLVDELDLTKIKATELLKAHEGDPVKAIKAFIAPPALKA